MSNLIINTRKDHTRMSNCCFETRHSQNEAIQETHTLDVSSDSLVAMLKAGFDLYTAQNTIR